tara:strand:- start:1313 stop:1543 length:231 start_codon:yes stop_codon:yes gene_type:complete
MRIDGITSADVKLLDIMWKLDTEEELSSWLYRQPLSVQKQAKVLIELATMADREDDMKQDDLRTSQSMLATIGIKC